MSWLRIREMVRKEFIQLFRDKRSRPILILTPLIQLLVFGYVVNYDIKDIRIALIDQARPGKAGFSPTPSPRAGSSGSPTGRRTTAAWRSCF